MPDSFFTSSKPRKRKRVEAPSKPRSSSKNATSKSSHRDIKNHGQNSVNTSHKKTKRARDEELSDHTDEGEGIDEMDLRHNLHADSNESGEEDDTETPAAKRLRLAKLYLESVKESIAEGEFDAAEIDRELISARLKQDVLEHSGKVHLFIADTFDFSQTPKTLITRGHRLSVTCAVASESGKHLFTSGKEGSIIKWDLSSGKRQATFYKITPPKSDIKGKGKAVVNTELKGHTDEVLGLAISGDSKLLASVGRDRKLCVWDVEKGEWIKSFGGHLGHKDTISVVSFKKGSNQLYTGSFDRTLKVYDLSPSVMGYVETLFGHQGHVLGLDSLRADTCVSVGGRDKTVRFWKIVEETQLVFRGGGRSRVREVLEGGLLADGEEEGEQEAPQKGIPGRDKKDDLKSFIEGSLECVAMVDESTFISGGDSGSVCLWNTQKKKPIFTQPLAHGFNEVHSSTEGVVQTPRWVTALASLRYSDLFVSGSWEGDIRMWKLDAKLRSFSLIGTIPIPGVVNSLQLLIPPKDFFMSCPWASHAEALEPNGHVNTLRNDSTGRILLVAGIGQEHRLGRWFSVKDGGATNSTVVVALSPRT